MSWVYSTRNLVRRRRIQCRKRRIITPNRLENGDSTSCSVLFKEKRAKSDRYLCNFDLEMKV